MRTLTPALALAAVLLTAACAGGGANGASGGAADVRTGGGSPWRGTALDHTHPLPDERFTDTEGKPFVPAEDADTPVTLVFFGYTYCPDVCNIVLANVASALRGASPDTRAKTQLLFVSTDPARDTPATVRDYLDRFDPAYAGLVAPVETVEQAASSLHIYYERPDGTRGGDYLVQHGGYTTAFVNGKARVVWAEDTSVADLRADLERLARIA